MELPCRPMRHRAKSRKAAESEMRPIYALNLRARTEDTTGYNRTQQDAAECSRIQEDAGRSWSCSWTHL
ncbi:hypothetical protein ACLKA7_007260 [Drosophila subpalustris]